MLLKISCMFCWKCSPLSINEEIVTKWSLQLSRLLCLHQHTWPHHDLDG